MKIVKTKNLKHQFLTFLLAGTLMWINSQIWFIYGDHIRTIILDHTLLAIGWLLINLLVLFMFALYFNDLIYDLTKRKPLWFGISILVLYSALCSGVLPVNIVIPTMVIITLILAYGIKQVS